MKFKLLRTVTFAQSIGIILVILSSVETFQKKITYNISNITKSPIKQKIILMILFFIVLMLIFAGYIFSGISEFEFKKNMNVI